MGTIVEWLGTVLSWAASAPNEWLISLWDWFLGPAGPRLGGIALTLVILGYANGARLDRRATSHKEVLAAEALELYERQVSTAPDDAGITVEEHLRPGPMPRLAWEHWRRFWGRWLQQKHPPWRVRHHRCARLSWSGRHAFNVTLLLSSAPSRREAMNQVLTRFRHRELTDAEFGQLNRAGGAIVWKTGEHGYLVVGPPLPHWRAKWRRDAARAAPRPVGNTPPANRNHRQYCLSNENRERRNP